jgi:hypothetical protein
MHTKAKNEEVNHKNGKLRKSIPKLMAAAVLQPSISRILSKVTLTINTCRITCSKHYTIKHWDMPAD